jgi:hypothetical protein
MKSDERRASYRCDITYTNNSVRCSVKKTVVFNLVVIQLRGTTFSGGNFV